MSSRRGKQTIFCVIWIVGCAVLLVALPQSECRIAGSSKRLSIFGAMCTLAIGMARANGGDDGERSRERRQRTRAERAAIKESKIAQIEQDLDEIHSQYTAAFGERDAASIGAVYARFSTRFQESIQDQIRSILTAALRIRVWVPRGHLFFDVAESGAKLRRFGLGRVEETLNSKKAQTVLLLGTNRLFRKVWRTLQAVDRWHSSWGVRCVFTANGIDTADRKQWEMLLQARAMVDQFQRTANVENVHAAHEGLLDRGLIYGTLPFGYTGDDVPNSLTARGLPKRALQIDEATASVVRQIFDWFNSGLSIAEIARMLNDDASIPLPERCESGRWTRTVVRRILANERYRGVWRYGVCEAHYDPEGDYVKQKPRTTPLKEVYFSHLQIVSDELFAAVQLRLAAKCRNGGRRPKDGDRTIRPKTLNGMMYCPHHDTPLAVYGRYGRKMVCLQCRDLRVDDRFLYSELDRKLALELTCGRIIDAINEDKDLVEAVVELIAREAEADQRPSPARIAAARQKVEQLQRSIDFAIRHVGSTDQDQRDAERTLRELRNERLQAASELQRLQAAGKESLRVPNADEVHGLLADLKARLAAYGGEIDVKEASILREFIRLVTGGRIDIYQCGEKKPQRGWLQGRFHLRLVRGVVAHLTGRSVDTDDAGREVYIDYRRPNQLDERAEAAWELYVCGKLCVEIGKKLGCSKSMVTKLLKRAATIHGETYVDGRKRRGKLESKQQTPPKHVQIADRVFKMWHGTDLLATEMAETLGVDRDTISRAIQHAHVQRGLPKPDGRNRRKNLNSKPGKEDAPGDAV